MGQKARKLNGFLPVTHLIRHYLLFILVVIFMLTLARSAYNLWQFDKVIEANVLIPSFLQGLRFDLALVGMVLAIPVFLVPILGMFKFSLSFARVFSIVWLVLGLFLILLLELLTPYFMQEQGLRPDLGILQGISDPLQLFSQLWSSHLVPAVIGVILVVLIMIAFWNRLEAGRFLRYPLRPVSAILFSILGLALCVLAVRSSVDFANPGMSPDTALISADATVNEITLNSAYKSAYSVFNQIGRI